MRVIPNIADFTLGELSPRLYGRLDLPEYRKGASSIVNYEPMAQGGFQKCAGTLYQGHTASDAVARVVRWVINDATRYIVEFTNNSIRFWKWSSGSLTYVSGQDIVTTYTTAELNALQFTWSYPYMFIVHQNHPPYMLTWASGDTFTGKNIVFSGANVVQSTVTITSGVDIALTVGALTPDIVGGSTYNNYVEKAVTGSGIQENTTISSVTDLWHFVINNASTNASGVAITISSPYLSGETPRLPFQSSGNYPGVVSVAFQRLFFADTSNDPLGFWASVVGFFDSAMNVQMGTYETVSIQNPQMNVDSNGQPTTQPPTYTTTWLTQDIVGDADGMYFDINSDRNDEIQWITPSVDLFIGTASGLFVIPANATANNVSASLVSRSGSAKVQASMVQGGCAFVNTFGRRVSQIGWNGIYNPWIPPDDLTFFAEHLFNKATIVMWDFQQNPETKLTFLCSDGTLVQLLMDSVHGVRAWYHRTTAGTITSVTVIPGDDRDVVVLSVTRNSYNLVEIIDDTNWYDTTQPNNGEVNANYLDAAVTQSSGTAFTVVTGLAHLDGLSVGMVGDGAYLGTATVSSGSVTLPTASKVAHVGLLFTATVQIMPLDIATFDQSTMGMPKNVAIVRMKYLRCLDAQVGPDISSLQAASLGGVDTAVANPPMFTGDEEVTIAADPRSPAYLVVQSSVPLPSTISAIVPQTEVA